MKRILALTIAGFLSSVAFVFFILLVGPSEVYRQVVLFYGAGLFLSVFTLAAFYIPPLNRIRGQLKFRPLLWVIGTSILYILAVQGAFYLFTESSILIISPFVVSGAVSAPLLFLLFLFSFHPESVIRPGRIFLWIVLFFVAGALIGTLGNLLLDHQQSELSSYTLYFAWHTVMPFLFAIFLERSALQEKPQ